MATSAQHTHFSLSLSYIWRLACKLLSWVELCIDSNLNSRVLFCKDDWKARGSFGRNANDSHFTIFQKLLKKKSRWKISFFCRYFCSSDNRFTSSSTKMQKRFWWGGRLLILKLPVNIFLKKRWHIFHEYKCLIVF